MGQNKESVFEQEFQIRWSDLDPNHHLRHSAYADLCAATRFHYLNHLGFSQAKFMKLRMGPILFSENLEYRREIFANEKVRVDVMIAGQSSDGRKWRIRHHIYRLSDGELCAKVEVNGAWFDVVERKVKAPPQELISAMEGLPRVADYQVLD